MMAGWTPGTSRHSRTLPGGQRDDRLVRPVFGPLPEHDVRLALERVARW
jgi:hypothetical protein